MRPALVTIVPMFAAAVLVMIGGERMARREVEKRTPADRDRLLDLADSFRTELERLDILYLGHLDDLARNALYQKSAAATLAAAEISGVRLIRIFQDSGKGQTITPDPLAAGLPEILLEGGSRPFNPAKAITLKKDLLEEPLPLDGVWLTTPDASQRIHLSQPEPGVLAAILIDLPEVRKRVEESLVEWLETPLVPLREVGGILEIDTPDGEALASMGADRHGPAAAIIPIRTAFGDWQIRAWDGLRVSPFHDPATIAVAAVLASVLALSGALLFLQQKRALRLAAQRVSFVNRVSHELGAPLTNLALNLDLATEFLTTRPAEARRRLGLVAEEIERLSRLVANVLTFSRHERDTLELKPCRVIPEEIVGRVLESFRPALARRGFEIETSLAAAEPVLLDPDALSQIVGNLISNVEKYAASGGWVFLGCELDAGFLVVEIRDRGPGIPEAARQLVFAPFARAQNATNEGSSGTGLGLSIGRDLACRMSGTLELLECPHGASFRLRVPAPPALVIVSSTTDAA